ncbi:hypothetical protein F0U62_20970 [Cystobacter fuscus]|uniref:hypothetical protein n=1 Tax=Cystobacter fuscus TaxID=43 RepID=UPI002B312424|nr:hypothetical protein F0U62_20970 [Cystobacter fuscus]
MSPDPSGPFLKRALNGRDPESLISVWGMMLRRHPDKHQLLATLKKLLAETIPKRLHLAFFLEHFFGTRASNVGDLLDGDGYREMRAEFVNVLLQSFTPNGAEKLIDAVKGGAPTLIYFSCWGAERIQKDNKIGMPFTGWSAFSDVLLDAVELKPEVMLDQLVSFVTKKSSRIAFDFDEGKYHEETVFSLDEEACRLFDHGRLVKLIQKGALSKSSVPWIQKAYQMVHESVSQRPPPEHSLQNSSSGYKKNSKKRK